MFAVCTHLLVAMLESVVAKKEICGLCLPNGEQMLAESFVNNSLLFLKVEPKTLRKALEIVQLFAIASRSQCNIEKSRLISLIKSDGLDYAGWIGEVVGKGMIF